MGDFFMYYSLSEVITICKQNMGIRDLPKPVTDQDIQWRLIHSALKEFSIRYPYTAKYLIGECNRICKPYVGVPTNHTNSYSQVYEIPKHYYQEHTILGVPMVEIQRPNGYNDLYVPQGMIGDPPNILILYNGWSGGDYEIELAMDHDPSLSTIPPSAMSTFIELCQYDLEEYFYQKLKRVQNLDLGIGSIELKIDDWADAANKKRDLLKELDETCNLDYEHIMYF